MSYLAIMISTRLYGLSLLIDTNCFFSFSRNLIIKNCKQTKICYFFLFTLNRPVRNQHVNVTCGAVFISWPWWLASGTLLHLDLYGWTPTAASCLRLFMPQEFNCANQYSSKKERQNYSNTLNFSFVLEMKTSLSISMN